MTTTKVWNQRGSITQQRRGYGSPTGRGGQVQYFIRAWLRSVFHDPGLEVSPACFRWKKPVPEQREAPGGFLGQETSGPGQHRVESLWGGRRKVRQHGYTKRRTWRKLHCISRPGSLSEASQCGSGAQLLDQTRAGGAMKRQDEGCAARGIRRVNSQKGCPYLAMGTVLVEPAGFGRQDASGQPSAFPGETAMFRFKTIWSLSSGQEAKQKVPR